jgi:hypothetical protein
MTWEMSQSLCLSPSFPKLLSLTLLSRPQTRIIMALPQLMKYVTTMGTRTVPPCLPLVAGAYSPQHHPLVVGAALRAAVVVARLSDALSVQWVSGGTQAASGVVTVMIYSSMLVRMNAMANLTAISIIMRCVALFPPLRSRIFGCSHSVVGS